MDKLVHTRLTSVGLLSGLDTLSPVWCQFESELIANARLVATPGKGILAADESTGTIGSRFQDIKVENSHESRIDYRRLLFTTAGLEQFISGVILFEETLFDKDPQTGKLLVQPLVDKKILLGIKVDQGTKQLPGTDNETYTQGLTDLDVRCKKYYAAGCRFAKWRAVLRIDQHCPSPLSIKETANTLASYAAICQANGLVPVVEPEILMDGAHTIEICQVQHTHEHTRTRPCTSRLSCVTGNAQGASLPAALLASLRRQLTNRPLCLCASLSPVLD